MTNTEKARALLARFPDCVVIGVDPSLLAALCDEIRALEAREARLCPSCIGDGEGLEYDDGPTRCSECHGTGATWSDP